MGSISGETSYVCSSGLKTNNGDLMTKMMETKMDPDGAMVYDDGDTLPFKARFAAPW